MEIAVKRLQDPVSPDDGLRVYIDRTLPRGVDKTKVAIDVWPKSVAPSEELKKWYGAGSAEKLKEFRKRYVAELDAHPQSVADIYKLASTNAVTLLYAQKEEKQSYAVVLREYLLKRAKEAEAPPPAPAPVVRSRRGR